MASWMFIADVDCAIRSKVTELKSETLRPEFILSSLIIKVKNEHLSNYLFY